MEWDKIFSINTKILDSVAGRYTAIKSENLVNVEISNIEKGYYIKTPVHNKHPELGDRPLFIEK